MTQPALQPWTTGIVDRTGCSVPPTEEGGWRLHEGGRYHIPAMAPMAVRLGPLALPWDAQSRRYALPLPSFQVGQTALTVQGRHYPIKVLPHADKSNPSTWARMLLELELAMPGASLGCAGLGQGEIGSAGVPAPFLIQALAPLVPELLRAFEGLCEHLRTASNETHSQRPLVQVRRPTPQNIRWLSQRSQAASWVLPDAEPQGPMPQLPVLREREDLRHPANLAVVWLVTRLQSRLRRAAERLQGEQELDLSRWRDALAQGLQLGAQRLKRTLRSSRLARLPPRAPDQAALLVLGDDPYYARFHSLARRFLSPAFERASVKGQAPQRASYDLYERWTLVELVAALEQALPAWRTQRRDFSKLLSVGERALSARIKGPHGSLRIAFNPSFPGYLERGQSQRWSISHRRRPDLTVTWRPTSGPGTWVALDAKYRVHPEMLADAFDSVHRYAHGLRQRIGGQVQPPQAVTLLTPRMHPECAPWYDSAFHEVQGCGALALAPGLGRERLGRWVLNALGLLE